MAAAVTAAHMQMSDGTVTDLLERLSSGRVDAAWSEFVARYTPLIQHVIRQHGAVDGLADECFHHVCGALSDERCRRLRSFRPDGPAQFRSWLVAVVANLCVDWRRKEQGRCRVPRSVAQLPELEQQVYRCIYLRRMSRAQCTAELAPRHAGLNEATVAAINARLFALLTPQQRWQLSVRNQPSQPIAYGTEPAEGDPAFRVATDGPGPDELAADLQVQQQLQEALSRLPADLRLLLRLRYTQNLTLAEVARLTGQSDPFRANRRIQAALAMLAGLMGGNPRLPDRKNP
jgi:RNA polymerase sigma factor (sigma-70 family)